MRVDFFEEFPNEKNLEKLMLVNFDSTLYVASSSFSEFESIKERIKKINSEIEIAYWPVLEKSYWISPFSYTYELKNLYDELAKNKREKLKILIDLELPFLNKKLFLLNLFSFSRNKKLIEKIFRDSEKLNLDILTAEYPIATDSMQRRLEWLGISYPIERLPHKKIVMFYSSTIRNKSVLEKIKNHIKKRAEELGDKLQVGLGTIAGGILGDEPVLSPKELDKDLSFYEKQNIDTVVIFRLGGLNRDYLRVIKKYL